MPSAEAGVAPLELAVDAEADERHRALGQRPHRAGALLLDQVGRVQPGRQRHDAQLEPAARRDPGRAQHRLLPGAVGVEGEEHDAGEAGQLADLVLGQRGAHQPDRVAQPRLVQGDDVGVALGQQHLARLRGVGPGQVGGEEVAALVEDGRLRGVEVLRLLVGAGRARPEAQDAPARVAERERDAPPEAVVDPVALAGALHEPGVGELLVAEAGPAGGDEDAVPGARRVADAELAQHALLQPARLEVLAGAAGLVGLPQHPHVVGGGALEQLEQPLALPAAVGGARVLLVELELDPVAVGEELERALEVDPLRELDVAEEVAALPAPEAVEDLLARVDPERRRALVVERAQPGHAARPRAAQLDPGADEVGHVDRVAHALAAGVGVARHQAAKDSGTLSASKARMQ